LDTQEIARIVTSNTARIDLPMRLRLEPYYIRLIGYQTIRQMNLIMHNLCVHVLQLFPSGKNARRIVNKDSPTNVS